MKLNLTSVAVRSAKPKYAYGERAAITLDSGAEMCLLRATVPADIPANAVVTKADIVLAVRNTLTGSRTVTAQRNAAAFQVSKVTWNNKPGVTGSTHSKTVGASAVNTEVRIDVLTDVQAFVAGSATNRGWRLTTNDTSRVLFMGSLAAGRKPYLDLEYILPGDAPVDLSPDGAAVSTETPTMTFTVPDDTISVQVKTSTSPDFSTLPFTTPEIFTGVGLVDMDGLAVFAPGYTFYWAARAKNENGWSPWSDVASFSRVLKPTVTITSPDTETGDKTPPITWTAADQVAWRARIYNAVTGALLDDSGYEGGTDQEWTPTIGLKRVGQTARIVVDVWDDVDRVATAGDPIYSRGTLVTELVALADTPGVDTLTATAGIYPYVRLAWSGEDADAWQVVRNGEWIDRLEDGGRRAWRDYYAEPGRAYTYRVLPVVDSGVGPNGPSATVLLRPPGLWLFDETEVVFVTDHEFPEVTWDERAVLHEVLGDAPPVRRRAGQPPPRGSVSGTLIGGTDPLLTAEAMKATAMVFKASEQGRVLRMSYGDRNIPVTIGDLMVEPNSYDSPLSYSISFKWWQTRDELPWDE